MKNNNKFVEGIKSLFRIKECFHKKRADLSFEEKIKILVHLQEIAGYISRSKNKLQKAWKIVSI